MPDSHQNGVVQSSPTLCPLDPAGADGSCAPKQLKGTSLGKADVVVQGCQLEYNIWGRQVCPALHNRSHPHLNDNEHQIWGG